MRRKAASLLLVVMMMSVTAPVRANEQATITTQETQTQTESNELDQEQSDRTTEEKTSTPQTVKTETKTEATVTQKEKQKKTHEKKKKVKKLKKTKKKEKAVHVKIKPTISSSYQEQSIKIKKNKEYIGKFIYFNQGDAAWNSSGYGIRSAGCGPTSMAVCISTLTGKWVTPVDTTSWAYKQGYYSSAGSEHRAIPAMAEHWGLRCDGLGTDYQQIKNSLEQGRPVVALMGPGYFTGGGHFMVLTEIDSDDNVTVADVGSRKRSQYKYSLSDVISQSKAASAGGPFWSIYKADMKDQKNNTALNNKGSKKQVLKIKKQQKKSSKKKLDQKSRETVQNFYTELSKNLTDVEKALPNSKVLIGKKVAGSDVPSGKINQCIYRLGKELDNDHLIYAATHYYFGEDAILHGDAKATSIDLNSQIQMLYM